MDSQLVAWWLCYAFSGVKLDAMSRITFGRWVAVLTSSVGRAVAADWDKRAFASSGRVAAQGSRRK